MFVRAFFFSLSLYSLTISIPFSLVSFVFVLNYALLFCTYRARVCSVGTVIFDVSTSKRVEMISTFTNSHNTQTANVVLVIYSDKTPQLK